MSNETTTLTEEDKKCAPSKKYVNGSCIPIEYLLKIVEAYNKHNPTNKIDISTSHEILNPNKYKLYLVKQLKIKIPQCDNQRCWLTQSFMKDLRGIDREDLMGNTFRPEGPAGKFTWLSTSNIDMVMMQYEEKYPDFKFLGAVPIDVDDLTMYGIKDLEFGKDNKARYGIVYNLDEHYKSGSHWVAMYFDIKKGNIYYSDSYGLPPEKRIVVFMNRISAYLKKNNIKPNIEYNRTQHQRGSSECGMYSLYFIISLLEGASFEEATKKRIPDELVNKQRDIYFIKTNKN